MHDVYQQSNERFIEEERPRVVQAASSHPNNPNLGLPYPYDSDDNEIENKETYYTNIKGGPIFRIFNLIEISFLVYTLGIDLMWFVKEPFAAGELHLSALSTECF